MTDVREIPIAEIKPFVSRARPREPFERLKASIAEHGLKMPVQVRKLGAGSRERGTEWKYERIVGEGRILACTELGMKSIPALVLDVSEGEIVGRFLAENVLRKKLPWQDKARLIQHEVAGRKITKAVVREIAERYFITTGHVAKLLRILQRAAPMLTKEFDKLTVEEAETLTTLPATGQQIVIETMREEGLSPHDVGAVVARARRLTQSGGELSKTALKASLKRVGEDLDRQRQRLKLLRLHCALGPENLRMVLGDRKFRKALDKAGVNVSKFEEAI
jgi:ParB/RepB/Spo0J family partition protein